MDGATAPSYFLRNFVATYSSYSQAWLEDPSSIRAIFASINVYNVVLAQEQTVYLSTSGYSIVNGTDFIPALTGSISLSESLPEDGSISMSYGDIEILNLNGEFDDWLDPQKYVWKNRAITLRLADPTWSITDATLATVAPVIFSGVVYDIDIKSRTLIGFKLRDKMERLNTPISEHKLGTYGVWSGGQQNTDDVLPLVFGEVFNITPMLIDPSLLEYAFSDGSTEALLEVRDNGAPIYTLNQNLLTGASVDLATGKFKLVKSTSGQITCSVQGVKGSIDFSGSTATLSSSTYANNMASLVALIATQYGNQLNRLALSEIDVVTFRAYALANTQPIGYFVPQRENVLSVCNNILSTKSSQIYFNREGLLQILQYGQGTTSAQDSRIVVTTIDEGDIYFNSLESTQRLETKTNIKLGYSKNWTVQPQIVSAIPQEHRDLLANEWLTYTASNTALTTIYKEDSVPVQQDTYFIRYTSVAAEQDARIEAERLLAFYQTPRHVFKMTCGPKALGLRLGQQVTLIHQRFNLWNSGLGKLGQVVGLSIDWIAGKAEVEILI